MLGLIEFIAGVSLVFIPWIVIRNPKAISKLVGDAVLSRAEKSQIHRENRS